MWLSDGRSYVVGCRPLPASGGRVPTSGGPAAASGGTSCCYPRAGRWEGRTSARTRTTSTQTGVTTPTSCCYLSNALHQRVPIRLVICFAHLIRTYRAEKWLESITRWVEWSESIRRHRPRRVVAAG